MAVIAMVAAAASAQGASGGLDGPGSGGEGCGDAQFGKRVLSRGDCGGDVKTLNWILNSKDYARQSPLGKAFKARTERSVVKFQRRNGIRRHGVVNRRTSRKLVRSMRKQIATWYGPGFYGNRTACGTRLTRRTVGVAHRRLPCGTKVTLKYGGRFLRTRVIDRGPYAHGAKWDLTSRAAKKLRFVTTDRIRAAVVR
jgi:rare lipoprotein A (peptidoglycan hydrolase)